MIRILTFTFILIPCLLHSQVREWTRLDGASVEAVLKNVSETKVLLTLAGGRNYEVPINQLSLSDHHAIGKFMLLRDYPEMVTTPENPKPVTPQPKSNERTVRLEAEKIENVFPGSTPRIRPLNPGQDPPPSTYVIESDSTRGTLELTFPNTLFDSAFTTVKSLTLVIQNSKDPYAGTQSRIAITRGREEFAAKIGARRGQKLQFQIDPERFRNRARIDITVQCGTDAVMPLQDPPPHIELLLEDEIRN